MTITHAIPLDEFPQHFRPLILAELVASGHKDIVLSIGMIRDMIANPNAIHDWRKLIEDYGMRFVDAHAPFGRYSDLNCPIQELRPAMLAQKRLAIELAAAFGVRTITIHVGEPGFLDFSLERLHEFLLESLEELLPLAEKLGVIIAIENIWFPTCSSDRLLDAVKRFQTPALGICYDSGHANIMAGKNVTDANHALWDYHQRGMEPPWNDHILEDVLPHVVNCHLHDNDGQRDLHLLPGAGTVDWPHIVELLRRAPRLDCVQNEANLVQNPAVTIAETVETFRRLFA